MGFFDKKYDVLKPRLAKWDMFFTILSKTFFGNMFFETRAFCTGTLDKKIETAMRGGLLAACKSNACSM